MPQLAGDRHAGRREIEFAVARVKLRADAGRRRHALQSLQKIEVKELSAELAVGDALQPDDFLLADDVPDGVVFDRAQLVLRDLFLLETPARVLEMLGP